MVENVPAFSRPRVSSPFQRIGTCRDLVMVIGMLSTVASPVFGAVTPGVVSAAVEACVTGTRTLSPTAARSARESRETALM
jgi:hypothetical protein